MDDEFDDKGWDGDMGDGEVSKILCFCIMWSFINQCHGYFLPNALLFVHICIKMQILGG
jgi:hypothetical protein